LTQFFLPVILIAHFSLQLINFFSTIMIEIQYLLLFYL
jgi:hypothetical protein